MKILTSLPKPNRSLSVIEVSILQATDTSVTARYRGAPVLKTYAPAEFLRKPIAEVTHQDFQPILESYLVGRPLQDTGYRLVCDFNCLMLWATKHGHKSGPHNPFSVPNRGKDLPELLSTEEMNAVITASCRMFHLDISSAISIRAMALLGLGVTDTCAFTLEKVDFNRWEYIHADTRGRLRIIPIPHEMRPLLAKARQIRPSEEGKGDNTFSAQSNQTLRNLVKRIGVEIGLPNLLPIQLTRTCIHGLPIAKSGNRYGADDI